jgi:SmpA/OmlA family protein
MGRLGPQPFAREVELVRWMTWVFTPIIAAFLVVIWSHRDSTIYASGYSWCKFSSIRNGMTPEEVTGILGQPLSVESFGGEVHWNYLGLPDEPIPAASGDGPISAPSWAGANFVADLSGRIISTHHAGVSPETEEMVGKSLDDVRMRYGEPSIAYTIPCQTIYWYSKLRNVNGEYVMLIHFNEEGRVYQIDADRIGHYCSSPGERPRPSSLLEWLEWYVL